MSLSGLVPVLLAVFNNLGAYVTDKVRLATRRSIRAPPPPRAFSIRLSRKLIVGTASNLHVLGIALQFAYRHLLFLRSHHHHRLRNAMYSHTPPLPPPKPSAAHEPSRISTPVGSSSSPLPEPRGFAGDLQVASSASATNSQQINVVAGAQPPSDPGNQWLPKFLEDKS